jgi:hypothetical protein
VALPCDQFEPQMAAFKADIEASPNPLLKMFLSVFEKCRQKEFGTAISYEMFRAAVQYRLHGEAGFKSVSDPCGSGPFSFERFSLEGVDRGFLVKSPYRGRGFQEAMIFVEKEGPPFRVNAINVGRPIGVAPLGK